MLWRHVSGDATDMDDEWREYLSRLGWTDERLKKIGWEPVPAEITGEKA